jgi:heat shock protein HslJ
MRKAALLLSLTVLLGGGAPGLRAQQEQAPPKPPYMIGDQLIGTRWQAESLRGDKVADPARATLDFLPGDQVRGQAGCKRFVGPFATRDDRINIGPVRTSLDTCRGPDASLEERVIEALQRSERVELGEDVLVLHDQGAPPSRFVPRKD